jgi:hypothetical protein
MTVYYQRSGAQLSTYGKPLGLKEPHPLQAAVDAAQTILDTYEQLRGDARRDAFGKVKQIITSLALSWLACGVQPPVAEGSPIQRLIVVARSQLRKEIGDINMQRRAGPYRMERREDQ